MRRLFFVASILLVWMGGITGCKMAGSANGSDSLAVDSFKYAFADSMLHCNIVADVPQGDDSSLSECALMSMPSSTRSPVFMLSTPRVQPDTAETLPMARRWSISMASSMSTRCAPCSRPMAEPPSSSVLTMWLFALPPRTSVMSPIA